MVESFSFHHWHNLANTVNALLRALVLLAIGLGTARVGAQQDLARGAVLLFEEPALRPGLCDALRIQLSDLATVTCIKGAAGESLAHRLEQSASEVTARGARLGVLLERDPNPAEVRMLLVGTRDDHALLAIERIEERPGPDVDRSLALKVRDTLEALSSGAAGPVSPAQLAVAIATLPHQSLRLRWSGLLEPGAALSLGKQLRAAGLFTIALRALRGRDYAELALGGQLASRESRRSEKGHVREDERVLGGTARAGRQGQRWSVGLLAELALVQITVRGSTNSGARGAASFLSARTGLGLDLRLLMLTAPVRLSIRFAPTVLVDPVRQRFEVDHQSTLELGRARLWLPLSLLLELPWQRPRV